MQQVTGPIVVGGLSRQALRERLARAGVLLNEYAQQLFEHAVFDEHQVANEIIFVTRSVGELGFSDGAKLAQIYAQAENLGLQLCPPVAGPYLRLAYTSQQSSSNSVLRTGTSPDEALNVAAPVLGDESFPKGFYLRVVDGVPWLRGYRCDHEHRFAPQDRFIFVDPQ